MGNASLARKTMTAINKADSLQALANIPQVFCPSTPQAINGDWTSSSLKVASVATLSCNTNYVLVGCAKMKCDVNGAWIFTDCTDNLSRCDPIKGPSIPGTTQLGEGESDPITNRPSKNVIKIVKDTTKKGEGESSNLIYTETIPW